MKFGKYLKDKIFYIVFSLIVLFLIFLIMRAFKVDYSIIFSILIILIVTFIIFSIYGYKRRYTYYHNLFNNIEKLDKAYLVLSTLDEPEFYDGKLLNEALYEINKSMIENVKELEIKNEDFKEYIEMWIHEVKIPLSALFLMIHNNNKEKFDNKTVEQIKRINNYVDQVLYYSRSENAEKDYLIKTTSIKQIINNVALKNKDELLENKINLVVEDTDAKINTDIKWLEFILDQIINNSIKYKRELKDSYIKINIKKGNNSTTLTIEDNGIGIPKEDIKRVFNKSFTGYNGRIRSKSTGMGLYIAKKLCIKLGHEISIESVKNKYTRVLIEFKNNEFYDVIK